MFKVELMIEDINKAVLLEKENDLVLDNFGLFWATMIQQWSVSRTTTLKNTSGTNRAISLVPLYPDYTSYNCLTGGAGKGNRIHIGTIGTSLDRTNNSLQAEYSSGPTNDATYSNGTITFSRTFQLASAISVRESAMVWQIYTVNYQTENFMMFRDTFSPISAATFTVTYRISLS